jgi:hypothetical protein
MSLDLPENYFDKMVTHPGGISRLLYYPPQVGKAAKTVEEADVSSHRMNESKRLLNPHRLVWEHTLTTSASRCYSPTQTLVLKS